MHRTSFPAIAAAIMLAAPVTACAQTAPASPAELGAKLDLLHQDMQAILRALETGGGRAPAGGAALVAPSAAPAVAPVSSANAVTAKFFPADPGLAEFPSPENSRMLRTGGGISGRPYLLDSTGAVHKLGPVTEAVPNGYTINGAWAKGGGSDHSPVPQLLVRQGKVFAQANGGPWQFFNTGGGSLYNASLPDAFQTDGSGQTTANVAPSAAKAPNRPARQSPAPGTSGRTLKVCSGCQFASISAAIKAAAAGDTVDIGPGRYKEAPPAWTVPLKIVFANGASLDLTGLTAQLARGKGALIPAADSIIVNPVITGVAMDQKVAQSTAAIRPDNGAGYVDIVGGELSGNQNGIAGGDAPVVMTVTGTKLSKNGLGDGYTHNIYMSHGTLSVTLKDVQSLDPNGGHAAKVRAFEFAVSGGSFEAFSAAAIDVPDGTVTPAIIDGATIIKKAGAYNHTVLDYATEDTSSGNGGMTLRNVTLELHCENPAILVGGGSVVTIEPSSKVVGTKPEGKGGTVKGL
jgi:hypothetical protein